MDTAPGFFIPRLPGNSLPQEELYRRIKQHISASTHFPVTNRRIFKLETEHNGTIKTGRVDVEVGKPLGQGGEIVLAIFETKGWAMIVTPTQGALTGSPKYMDAKDVTKLIEFSR